MRLSLDIRLAALGFFVSVAAICCGAVVAGLALAQPTQSTINAPPADLNARVISFASQSGAVLHGWMSAGKPGCGVVVLLHGVRANRTAMVRRAMFLHQQGFGVVLFDFQAHGESVGRHITFGHLEGLDAASAVTYAHQAFPGERVGVIGVSLGGAAALLGPKPLDVDGLVLESVYADINSALRNRLRVRLGRVIGPLVTPILAPLLEWVMPPILGTQISDLRPIEHAGEIAAPVLIASGTEDAYTPIAEARALSARAPAPKQFWAVENAAHVDLEAFGPDAYWRHVLPFLTARLR